MEVLLTNPSLRIWPNKSHFYEKEYIFFCGFVWRKESGAWLSVAHLESIFQKQGTLVMFLFLQT